MNNSESEESKLSGGSYCYIYSRLEEECVDRMHDIELNDMIKDLVKVLHDLEWWQSGDYSEKDYRDAVEEFKTKWLKGDRKTRLKGYIDKNLELCRKELYELIGYTSKNMKSMTQGDKSEKS